MVGSAYRREKTTKTLEKAVATLEGLFGGLIASEDEAQREQFRKIGRLPLSSLVSELGFYIRLINGADRIAVDTESHSLVEVCKYLLASYAKRATGNFHDRNVSGLIEELSGSSYEELAQRMWRRRNYSRLDKHSSWLTDILIAASVVIAQSA
jgi:hypothetical protein